MRFRFFATISIIFIAALSIMSALVLLGINTKKVNINKNNEIVQAETFADNKKSVNEEKNDFLLKRENDTIAIYYADSMALYDYALLNQNILPADVDEQLNIGLYINGLDDLYDFLQAYSS